MVQLGFFSCHFMMLPGIEFRVASLWGAFVRMLSLPTELPWPRQILSFVTKLFSRHRTKVLKKNLRIHPCGRFSASKIAAIFRRNLSWTNRSQNVADVGSTFTLNLQFFAIRSRCIWPLKAFYVKKYHRNSAADWGAIFSSKRPLFEFQMHLRPVFTKQLIQFEII